METIDIFHTECASIPWLERNLKGMKEAYLTPKAWTVLQQYVEFDLRDGVFYWNDIRVYKTTRLPGLAEERAVCAATDGERAHYFFHDDR